MGTGKRHELTDAAWAVVVPLLPATPKADRPKRRDQVRSSPEPPMFCQTLPRPIC